MKTRKRRRLEGKTDYLNRKNLLKSGKPRIVFRKTNKYVIAQYVESKEAKDKIKIGMNSKILLKYGWPKQAQGSLKTIPASYFLGFLIGKKIVKEKLENPIVDFGMLRTIPKNKLFGFLKGLIDSGIKINCKEENFPSEEKKEGKNLKNKINFKEIKSKIENE